MNKPLKHVRDWGAETAIVLGSGLNSLALTCQRRLVANRRRGRLLQQLGADAIGVCTVLEVIQRERAWSRSCRLFLPNKSRRRNFDN
jgi:purine nucleoside phosphorylase